MNVRVGFQSLSSDKMLKHTVPLGYTLGWNSGGSKAPAQARAPVCASVRQRVPTPATPAATRPRRTLRGLRRVLWGELQGQLVHAVLPRRLCGGRGGAQSLPGAPAAFRRTHLCLPRHARLPLEHVRAAICSLHWPRPKPWGVVLPPFPPLPAQPRAGDAAPRSHSSSRTAAAGTCTHTRPAPPWITVARGGGSSRGGRGCLVAAARLRGTAVLRAATSGLCSCLNSAQPPALSWGW